MATFDRVKKVVVDQLDVNEDEVTPTASFVETSASMRASSRSRCALAGG